MDQRSTCHASHLLSLCLTFCQKENMHDDLCVQLRYSIHYPHLTGRPSVGVMILGSLRPILFLVASLCHIILARCVVFTNVVGIWTASLPTTNWLVKLNTVLHGNQRLTIYKRLMLVRSFVTCCLPIMTMCSRSLIQEYFMLCWISGSILSQAHLCSESGSRIHRRRNSWSVGISVQGSESWKGLHSR